MLEQLRRNSRSWLIWFIFALLIAAFALFFGPQSRGGDMFGCGKAAQTTVAEVGDGDVSVNSWRFAMNGLGFGSGGGHGAQAAARRATAIDFLVERELLAQEAERLGFHVTDDLVAKRIREGEFYVLGQKVDGSKIYFDGDVFSYKFLERYAQQLGLPSVDSFISEQKHEIMADFAREMLARSAVVSDEEARADYIHRNTTVTADYLRFEVSTYKNALELSEADARAYLAAHKKDVEAKWEQEKAQFASDKDRVLLRHILIKKAPASDDAKAKGDAKARADKARARIEGGEDFAAVAADVSEDARTRPRGGLVGWKVAATLGYGSAVSEAVKDLEAGKVSKVIESPTGFHIFKIEKRSKKGLTFEDRKLEIAFDLAADHDARELARRDAEAALASVKTAGEGKNLADLFKRAAPPPGAGGLQGPGAPQLSPEQLEQIRKQMEKGLSHPKEGGDKPDQKPDQKPDEEPKPEPKKSGWIFHQGDVVLAQAGGASTPAPAPAAAASDATKTAESLPHVDVEPPEVHHVGPAPRPTDMIAGIGRSKAVVKALFDSLSVGQVADQVFEVTGPDAFVVVQLVDREQADLDKFDAEKADTRDRLEQVKAVDAVLSWTKDHCQRQAKSGGITVNTSYLTYDDDKAPMPYSACSNISQLSVYRQLASRHPGQGGFF